MWTNSIHLTLNGNYPAAPNGEAEKFGLNDRDHLCEPDGKDSIYSHKIKLRIGEPH